MCYHSQSIILFFILVKSKGFLCYREKPDYIIPY